MERSLDSTPMWIDLDRARQAMLHGSGKGVRIAVLDSGIEFDHPDLAGLKSADDLQIAESGVQPEVKQGKIRTYLATVQPSPESFIAWHPRLKSAVSAS